MNASSFWTLLDQSWQSPDGLDPCHQLERFLGELPIDELFSFMTLFELYRDRLRTPSHLAAAYLLNEGAFDEEDFLLYTEAIVAVPEWVYLDVEHNPDHILDYKAYDLLLQNDGYPFASLPNILGKKEYGELWQAKLKGAPFDPTNLDDFRVNERFSPEFLSPALCAKSVPRLFSIYGGRCEWD